MSASTDISRNYQSLERRIAEACALSGRSRESVLLVAATKTQPIESLRVLYDFGLRDFGENKAQDLVKRREALPDDIRWHFIGHLQSNKAKYIAPFVSVVHSIDSLNTAIELSTRAKQSERIIPVLLEANISGEPSKHGVDVEKLNLLFSSVLKECDGLKPIGLMGMAAFADDPDEIRSQFVRLRRARESLKKTHSTVADFNALSMGMSNDFELAIREGATMIRVGSELFGERL